MVSFGRPLPVIRNVYGTFNFIWIITICFRSLAEKCLALAVACSLTLFLSLSGFLCFSHAPFAASLPGTMSHEVGGRILALVLSDTQVLIFHCCCRKCNCEFQTNVKFEFTSLTFLVTSKIICLACLQTHTHTQADCSFYACGCVCFECAVGNSRLSSFVPFQRSQQQAKASRQQTASVAFLARPHKQMYFPVFGC